MHASIEHFYCSVRAEYLYDLRKNKGKFVKAIPFGVTSIGGRALGFNVILESGAQFARLPISALVHDKKAPNTPLDYLQLWDCFGESIHPIKYDYLTEMRCKVLLKDKTWQPGQYMMSFDWADNGFSNEPSQVKIMHLIKLDNGCYALQPNNRILWFDPSFVSAQDRPDYLVNTHIFKCETAEHWTVKDEDKFFYDLELEREK